MLLYCSNKDKCDNEDCVWRYTVDAAHKRPEALSFICYRNRAWFTLPKSYMLQYDRGRGRHRVKWNEIFDYMDVHLQTLDQHQRNEIRRAYGRYRGYNCASFGSADLGNLRLQVRRWI